MASIKNIFVEDMKEVTEKFHEQMVNKNYSVQLTNKKLFLVLDLNSCLSNIQKLTPIHSLEGTSDGVMSTKQREMIDNYHY